MVLGLLMVADVQVHQLPDAVLVHGLDAPLLIGHDHLAELGAPVPQVVHAHRLVPQVLIDAVEGVADGGAGQVVEAEGLGDVDGGIVQHHVPALALVGTAVGFPRVQDLCEHVLGLLPLLDEEVEIGPHSLRLLDARGQDQLLLKQGKAMSPMLGFLGVSSKPKSSSRGRSTHPCRAAATAFV